MPRRKHGNYIRAKEEYQEIGGDTFNFGLSAWGAASGVKMAASGIKAAQAASETSQLAEAAKVTDDAISAVDDAANVTSDAVNASDKTLNLTEHSTSVTDDAINTVDDAVNVTDDAVNTVDDAANITDDATKAISEFLDESGICFKDREEAIYEIKKLQSKGYDIKELYQKLQVKDESEYQRLLNHDLKFEAFSKTKGLDGCHTDNFLKDLTEAAQSGNGNTVDISDILRNYANEPGNAPEGTIRQVTNTNGNLSCEMSLSHNAGRSTTQCTMNELPDSVATFEFHGGKKFVKSFAPEEDLKYVIDKLHENGIVTSRPLLNPDSGIAFGPSGVVQYNGRYYFTPVRIDTGTIPTCIPLSEEALVQRGFIKELVPILK